MISFFLVGLLLFSDKLPERFIPVEHNLRISASSKTGLVINSIKKIIKEPHEEITMIDWDVIRQANPDLEFRNNDIYIYSGEELYYVSFFAGCIQVDAQPIGESAVVQIDFDSQAISGELLKKDNIATPFILCSQSNFSNLPLKWKLIVAGLRSLDFIFFAFLISNGFYLISTIQKIRTGKISGIDVSVARKLVVIFTVVFTILHIWFLMHTVTGSNPNIPAPVFYHSGYTAEDLFLDSRHPKGVVDYISFLVLEKNPGIEEIYIPESVRSLCGINEEKLDQWIPADVTILIKEPERVRDLEENEDWRQYRVETNIETCTHIFIKSEYDSRTLYMELIGSDLYIREISTFK